MTTTVAIHWWLVQRPVSSSICLPNSLGVCVCLLFYILHTPVCTVNTIYTVYAYYYINICSLYLWFCGSDVSISEPPLFPITNQLTYGLLHHHYYNWTDYLTLRFTLSFIYNCNAFFFLSFNIFIYIYNIIYYILCIMHYPYYLFS